MKPFASFSPVVILTVAGLIATSNSGEAPFSRVRMRSDSVTNCRCPLAIHAVVLLSPSTRLSHRSTCCGRRRKQSRPSPHYPRHHQAVTTSPLSQSASPFSLSSSPPSLPHADLQNQTRSAAKYSFFFSLRSRFTSPSPNLWSSFRRQHLDLHRRRFPLSLSSSFPRPISLSVPFSLSHRDSLTRFCHHHR